MTFKAVIDPAWGADAGGGGRGAQNHYALSTPSKIAEAYYAARDDKGARIWPALNTREPMLVFMWATTSSLRMVDDDADPAQLGLGTDEVNDLARPPDAYVLARLLGIRVCARLIWAKVDTVIGSDRVFTPPKRMGLGQWTRCEHEELLICRRGKLTVPATAARPRSMIYAPRGEHSEKPAAAWDAIDLIANNVMPNVVGVEFNARVQRAGWHAYGALDGEEKPLRFARFANTAAPAAEERSP